MNWAFWIGLTISYLSMTLFFIIFIHGAEKLRKDRERKQCMMNHPAGKQHMIEHSRIGRINETLRPLTPEERHDWRRLTKSGWNQSSDDDSRLV